ncbi:hypothetical protein OG196_42875 [Kitasatospora purpeofusca]|uniref:hypothetical protein n=1 Tax=Kitasatospora purpeofusca TaxID=67352 RepID=UPI002E0EBE0F|nr:hypothetical protein OG196_00050 [Kitasatospora purpeofusca]WSR45250.1 hypothetical protein OG196_42875 [Kitasatospora purpeofusca]
MNGPVDVRFVVLLLAGAGAAYVAYLHPSVGTALLVGVAVMTILYILMGTGGGDGPTK